MGRRGENIRKRKDGRWEARVVCGPPVDGRTSYKYLYSSSYQGAKNLKKEFLAGLSTMPKPALESPVSPPSTVSDAPLFSDVANEWLAGKKLSVKKSTYANYSFIPDARPAGGDGIGNPAHRRTGASAGCHRHGLGKPV